jgi:flagellar M-ring protein FliF
MARLGAMGAVAALLIGFFIFITTQISAPRMMPLYADLTMEDSTAITRALDADRVTYELKSGGATVMVPEDQVLRLRMQLAGDGLPTGGSVGYEIFDKSNTLGATSFVQNINHLRALEGELARTIRTIDRIAFARVHLVIPERQLFQKDRNETTASIVLKVRGALEQAQVRAIQHLVASAVDGLKPERVSIVDETGALLATGGGGDDATMLAGTMSERSLAFENRLQRDIEAIVSSVVGSGRARIQVAAEFDYKRVTKTADSFDPETQVIRSAQRRIEESTAAGARGGPVSVGNALPEAGSGGGGSGGGSGDSSNNTEETINYEISRTTTTEVQEPGRLKRVSVAVLVDGNYAKEGTGDLKYEPRPPEELERIASLVRTAVGFDKERGDSVEVVNLRFAEAPRLDEVPVEESGGFLGLEKADYFYIAQLVVTIMLGIAVLLFGLRPLLRRLLKAEEPGAAPPAYAASPAGAGLAAAAAGAVMTRETASETAMQIERAMQTGALHADTIKRVGSLVEENPADAVAIVRSWLADAA